MWSSPLLAELSSRISSRSLKPSKKPARSRSGIWIAHCYFVVISRHCMPLNHTAFMKKIVALQVWTFWIAISRNLIRKTCMPLNCIAFMTDCYSCIASMAFGIAIPLRFYSEILVLLKIFLHCFCFYLEILLHLNIFTLLLNIMPLITHCIMYYYSTFDYLAMLLL